MKRRLIAGALTLIAIGGAALYTLAPEKADEQEYDQAKIDAIAKDIAAEVSPSPPPRYDDIIAAVSKQQQDDARREASQAVSEKFLRDYEEAKREREVQELRRRVDELEQKIP